MFTQTNNPKFTAPFSPRRRAFYSVLFALAQILLVCGCAVIPKHPEQIPAFAPGDGKFGSAPKIAGHYANKGEAFTVKGESLGQVLLSRLLFIDQPASPAQASYGRTADKVKALLGDNSTSAADSVTVLEPEPDMVELQFFKQGQSVATRRFSKYTWNRATGGWGIFANWDSSTLGQPYYEVKGFMDIGISESHGGVPGVGMYVSGMDCLLKKGVDGSLIVLQRESGFGAFVIVPVWNRRDMWGRFPPIEDSGQSQPGTR
jgi:hypothetical protein